MQVDQRWPKRNKASDGTIGDAAHASRNSDHNPWIKEANSRLGVVSAIDITHDPGNGPDCNVLAAALIRNGDKRIKYIIWSRRIWNPDISPYWRPYNGANTHTKHLHLSVRSTKGFYDNEAEWKLD